MAYNTPETVADYLARFQMEITHRGKGTFTPDHVKYSLTIANGGKDFSTTFESNPHVHGEPTITQVFGALASDAMVVRDYGMDEFVDEFCDGMKPSAAIRAYNSCKETYDWMRDGLYLSNGDIASLSEVIGENEEEIGALVEKAASERAARYAYDHPKLPKGFVTIEQLQGDLDLGDLRDEVEDFDLSMGTASFSACSTHSLRLSPSCRTESPVFRAMPWIMPLITTRHRVQSAVWDSSRNVRRIPFPSTFPPGRAPSRRNPPRLLKSFRISRMTLPKADSAVPDGAFPTRNP